MADEPGLSEISTTTQRSRKMGMKYDKTPQRFTSGGAAGGGSSKGNMPSSKPPENFTAGGAGHTSQSKPSGKYQRDSHPKQVGVNNASGFQSPGRGYGIFNPPAASNAHVFKGTNKAGVLRTSGKGHMVGSKK